MTARTTPEKAREALKKAIEWLIEEDGYTEQDIRDLVEGALEGMRE